jgi:hypothetical protein
LSFLVIFGHFWTFMDIRLTLVEIWTFYEILQIYADLWTFEDILYFFGHLSDICDLS